MRKIVAFTGLLLLNTLTFAFSGDTTIIEINDASLSSVSYHQQHFTTPTKLVFKNLTTVTGSIYFHQNTNLLAVAFPLLKSCDGSFNFYQNTSLQAIIAPELNTIKNYLSVYGNTALTQLDICNLKQILPADSSPDPYSIYYAISNNTPPVDQSPACFSKGAPTNLDISGDSITENQPGSSLVGKLSANGNTGDQLRYYLPETATDNRHFLIRNDSLLSAAAFDYESRKEYQIQVAVTNQLGEKMTKDLLIKITPDQSLPDTTFIEITDTSLSSVSYHQQHFTTPTRLVFKNLLIVTGNIYFHQNSNLVSVAFPKLESCNGFFYFYQNTSLQKIIAPVLTSVQNYLAINSNSALTELDICNLKQILPSDASPDPYTIYYAISNNTPAVDQLPVCFSTGVPTNISLSNDSIRENLPANSFIGKVSANSNTGDQLHYFLPETASGNSGFLIRNDTLFAATPFDYETRKEYPVEITAINQLGEKTSKNFTIRINDLAVEDTVTVVIDETTMPSVFYHHNSFINPTKLVFAHLTTVLGDVYFHQNTNLLEVDFPLLDSTGGLFFFNGNESLQKISATVLETVHNYLYIYGNLQLRDLNICSLSRILPTETTRDPYYFIANNNNLDYASTCLTKTNVIYVPVKNIAVRPVPNTFIGYFISDAAATDTVRYYFVDSQGKETSHPDFSIRGDTVFLTKNFSFYTDTSLSFDVNAIRSENTHKRPTDLASSLKEKIVLQVKTNISNPVHYANRWIGPGTNAATSAWENPGNWSLHILPDANTDVIISAGNVTVGTNAICHSLKIEPGANIIVESPYTLTITQ